MTHQGKYRHLSNGYRQNKRRQKLGMTLVDERTLNMLTLVETVTGFAAIMLMLSLLVKSLTSVIKNTWDYYCSNLEYEVKRLVWETLGKTWNDFVGDPTVQARAPWLAEIHWNRLGDDFLTPGNMQWLLKQLDPNKYVSDLESRVAVHLSKVKYAFEMRMKNLALATGLGMCLFMNINSFAIWESLYTDQQLRATFSTEYAKKATSLAAGEGAQGSAQKDNVAEQSKVAIPKPVQTDPARRVPEQLPQSASQASTMEQKKGDQPKAEISGSSTASATEDLKNQESEFKKHMRDFLSDVSFGVGRIWRSDGTEPTTGGQYAYEFFGSLLTGILVSIGAPYWHDVLTALAALRPDKSTT